MFFTFSYIHHFWHYSLHQYRFPSGTFLLPGKLALKISCNAGLLTVNLSALICGKRFIWLCPNVPIAGFKVFLVPGFQPLAYDVLCMVFSYALDLFRFRVTSFTFPPSSCLFSHMLLNVWNMVIIAVLTILYANPIIFLPFSNIWFFPPVVEKNVFSWFFNAW